MIGRGRYRYEQVYAIVRVDLFQGESIALWNKITVKKVVRDHEVAEKEVERLNRLQAGKDVEYFWQMTRLQVASQGRVKSRGDVTVNFILSCNATIGS